jgi:hypothetical protein
MGPPILCHPISIGNAESLPGGDGKSNNYDSSKVVQDTLVILKSQRDPLVHMETLRRASMIIGNNRNSAMELLARSACRILDEEGAARKDPLPWLDAGFLVACFEQTGVDLGFRPGVADNVRGYAYVLKALELARVSKDAQAPAMEFGAALVAHPMSRRGGASDGERQAAKATYDGHIARAVAGAPAGSLLEQNLTTHLKAWGSSIEEVRRLNRDSGSADARKPK